MLGEAHDIYVTVNPAVNTLSHAPASSKLSVGQALTVAAKHLHLPKKQLLSLAQNYVGAEDPMSAGSKANKRRQRDPEADAGDSAPATSHAGPPNAADQPMGQMNPLHPRQDKRKAKRMRTTPQQQSMPQQQSKVGLQLKNLDREMNAPPGCRFADLIRAATGKSVDNTTAIQLALDKRCVLCRRELKGHGKLSACPSIVHKDAYAEVMSARKQWADAVNQHKSVQRACEKYQIPYHPARNPPPAPI